MARSITARSVKDDVLLKPGVRFVGLCSSQTHSVYDNWNAEVGCVGLNCVETAGIHMHLRTPAPTGIYYAVESLCYFLKVIHHKTLCVG